MNWNAVEPVSELKKIVAKPQIGKRSPWYARKVIRKISVYFSWLFLHTNLTANQVTLLQNFVGLLGFFLLCSSRIGWAFAGILLIQLSYVLDCVDGEIARYRKTPSVNGIFLDFFNHVTVIPLIPVGLGFHYYYLSGHSILYPVLGILGGIFSMSPINLATNETILYLLTKKKSPAYNYENLKSTDNGSGRQVHAEVPKTTPLKKLIQTLMTYSGYAMHYPGSMNVVTIFIVLEIFLQPKQQTILFFAYTIYLAALILRELYLFTRYVMNNESEKKYVQVYQGFHELKE